mgnify:CR=1 FL=1
MLDEGPAKRWLVLWREDLRRIHADEVALCMPAYRTHRRCLQAMMHMSAVQAQPRDVVIAFKELFFLQPLSQLTEPVAVRLFDFSNHLKRTRNRKESLFLVKPVTPKE